MIIEHNYNPLTDEEWERMPGHDEPNYITISYDGPDFSTLHISRTTLDALRAGGITVNPPANRYRVEFDPDNVTASIIEGNSVLADFYGTLNIHYAYELRDVLNGQAKIVYNDG